MNLKKDFSSDEGGENLEQEFEYYSAINQIAAELEQMDIPGAVHSVQRVTDLVEKLLKLKAKSDNAELVEVTIELRLELSNMRVTLANANDEVAALKGENRSLKEEIEKLKTLKTEEMVLGNDGLYYTKETSDGPFCTRCYDEEQKKIRATKLKGNFTRLATYLCPSCKSHY